MPKSKQPAINHALKALADEVVAIETQYGTRGRAKAGRRIIDRLYQGDIASFRSKKPGSKTLRDLAELLHRSPTRVWYMVAVSIVYDSLPVDLRDRLTPTHLEVIYHADDVEWERLAREVVALDLTTEETEARVGGQILPDPRDRKPIDRSALGVSERTADRLDREADRATPEERPKFVWRLDAMIARYIQIRAKFG